MPIHADDPLDGRPVRPVGGSDFDDQRPRTSLIRDLHSHGKIATDGASAQRVSVRMTRSSPTVVRSSPDAKAARGVASMKATTTRPRKAEGRPRAEGETPCSPPSEIRQPHLPISRSPGRGDTMPGN